MRTEFTKQQLIELKTALKDKKNARHHRKLQAIILYAEGMSLVKSAEATDFVHQTVRNLSNRYLAKGLSAILTDKRGGRRWGYMTLEEAKHFLNQFITATKEGKFVTIQEIYEDYQQTIGHTATRECLYGLLKRHNWRKVTSRPQHPRENY